MEIESQAWHEAINTIAGMEGKVILHSFLRTLFQLSPPKYKDFECEEDYIKALDMFEFEYLTITEKLKRTLLQEHQMCLKNVRGEGYIILNPEEQTTYAFNKLNSEIKKSFRDATFITSNVRKVSNSAQRAKDNDMRSKIAIMKQVLTNVK